MQSFYCAGPSPHILLTDIVPDGDYRTLVFPDDLIPADNGWGLTEDDPAYRLVLQQPVWQRLYDHLKSHEFARGVLEHFRNPMRLAGCRVDPDNVYFSSYLESMTEKSKSTLSIDADPDELFTRVDFLSRGPGQYRSFVHLDWPRRLVGGILFFSDADREGLIGGEFGMYRDATFRNDRWCNEPVLEKIYTPRHNTGIIFLNSNGAFHGPTSITSQVGRRRWIYYTISSRADIWPAEPSLAELTQASFDPA